MYEFLDHTADILYRVRGSTIEELFEKAAEAMISVMVDLDKVEVKNSVEVELKGSDLKELLHNWLSELLFLVETQEMVFSKFAVKVIKDGEKYLLKGKVWGEKINPEKHQFKTEVKAVTYHMMEIESVNGGYETKVLLDI